MIHAQNHKIVAEVPSAAIGATASATLTIDTLGWDHCSLSVIRANNASTLFSNVVKVSESDESNANFTDVTALVGGGTGGFTVPPIPAASTGAASVVKVDVDTKAKKRYLRVTYTPGASANVAIVGRLGRGEESANTASEANVLTMVRG